MGPRLVAQSLHLDPVMLPLGISSVVIKSGAFNPGLRGSDGLLMGVYGGRYARKCMEAAMNERENEKTPDLGIEPRSPPLQTLLFTTWPRCLLFI